MYVHDVHIDLSELEDGPIEDWYEYEHVPVDQV